MSGKKKAKAFTPVANVELAQAMAAIAFSNAWGTHADRRTRRARTRSTAKVKAIRDSRDY